MSELLTSVRSVPRRAVAGAGPIVRSAVVSVADIGSETAVRAWLLIYDQLLLRRLQ